MIKKDIKNNFFDKPLFFLEARQERPKVLIMSICVGLIV